MSVVVRSASETVGVGILTFVHSVYGREIFQYLDEVDYNCDRTISSIQLQKIPESYRSDIEYNLDAIDIVGDLPK